MSEKLKVGISTCLLGENVRYDGQHKLDRFLRDTLGRFVEYVPVCPEVECGLPVPREAMRLVGEIDNPRLMTIKTQQDITPKMVEWAKNKLNQLKKENLCGFIFKKGSPSSGLQGIKVYNEHGGPPTKKGTGIFAKMFVESFPRIPVEDEGRLHDPGLRENFIERIFVFQRWRNVLDNHKNRGGLVSFHTMHKLLIMSHSQKHYADMGKLVAKAKELSYPELFDTYEQMMSEALRLKTSNKKNANVLMHIMGYFKQFLTPDEKQELLTIIDNYRMEIIPIIVPVTLMNHYVRKYNQPYLKEQWYLNPHPLELQLRNHV